MIVSLIHKLIQWKRLTHVFYTWFSWTKWCCNVIVFAGLCQRATTWPMLPSVSLPPKCPLPEWPPPLSSLFLTATPTTRISWYRTAEDLLIYACSQTGWRTRGWREELREPLLKIQYGLKSVLQNKEKTVISTSKAIRLTDWEDLWC